MKLLLFAKMHSFSFSVPNLYSPKTPSPLLSLLARSLGLEFCPLKSSPRRQWRASDESWRTKSSPPTIPWPPHWRPTHLTRSTVTKKEEFDFELAEVLSCHTHILFSLISLRQTSTSLSSLRSAIDALTSSLCKTRKNLTTPQSVLKTRTIQLKNLITIEDLFTQR